MILVSQKPEYFGKYILLEKLAAGGMAEVFLSRAPGAGGIGKFVAIKRILPQFSDNKEFVDMFKDEAKIAINLSHNNIVSIFEFGVELGQFFLVMDYVKGKNIRQILNKLKQANMQFGVDQIVYVCKEIAAGLDHAHRCLDGSTGKPLNITHRDMSPQNVMVSFEGEIKIIDFGIAKSESQLETTRAGTLKGKFGYMSPEQAEGQVVDLRTDIFSLGIVLWELLANDRLFIANNEINTLRKIRDCQIPSLTKVNPEVHPELERIVLKALTKDRNQRYQTSAALHRDLSRFLNRHYPDFSSQDFSMFVKSLYADEIMDLNNKLIEFSQISFDGDDSTTVEGTGERFRDDTVTETNNAGGPQSVYNSLGLGAAKRNEQISPKISNNIGLNNNLTRPQGLPSVANENNSPIPDDEIKNSMYSVGQGSYLNQDSSQEYNPFESYEGSSNMGSNSQISNYKGLAPSLLNRKETAKVNPTKIAMYGALTLLVYLLLASLLPTQMQPLTGVVNNSLEGIGACQFMRTAGIVKTIDSIGLASTALCEKDILTVKNTNTNDEVEGSSTESSKATPVSININSDPSGAKIIINGKFDNLTTPALVPFIPGETVTLELEKAGYKKFETENFDPNYLRSRTFKPRLEKMSFGYISVDAKPPQFSDMFSEIYINGQKINQQLPIIRYAVPANQETTVELVNPVTNKKTVRKVFLDAEQNKSIVIYLKRAPANSNQGQ